MLSFNYSDGFAFIRTSADDILTEFDSIPVSGACLTIEEYGHAVLMEFDSLPLIFLQLKSMDMVSTSRNTEIRWKMEQSNNFFTKAGLDHGQAQPKGTR